METMSEKQHAHELIERLPAVQIETAVRFLEFMLLDPMARALATAPLDDELMTEGDRRRLDEGQVRLARGEGTPMEEVLAEFCFNSGGFSGGYPGKTPKTKWATDGHR